MLPKKTITETKTKTKSNVKKGIIGENVQVS